MTVPPAPGGATAAEPDDVPPAEPAGATAATRPSDTRRSRLGTVALIVAALLGSYLFVAQLFAVLPVSWTAPLLQNRTVQHTLLLLGSLRDSTGAWNLILGAVAVALAVFAGRRRRPRWLTGAVAGVSGAALALTVVVTVALVAALHQHTGRWMLFSPPLPLATTGGQPDHTVTYATFDGTPLQGDIYLPASDGPAPLVVTVHGGGFTGGTRGPNRYTRWLADRGYAVFDVDYRLSDVTTQRWNTQESDIACAMTWAAAQASEFGWDMDRVATFGGSAGGNLAINVANKINAETLTPTCGAATDLPRIRAAIGIYPAVDVTASATDTAGGADLGRTHLGGPPDEYRQRYSAVDSAPHLGPDSPPTLLVQSGADHLVFASHTAGFADALAAAGVTHRHVEVPFVEHGYDAARTTGTELGRSLTLDWLQRHTG